jgi:hypothetical protein
MKLTVRLGIFGAVPMGLLQDKTVKPNGIKAYIALSSFQGTNESCFPGLEKIAERAGIDSVPATSEAIRGLVQAGWVEKIRRGKGLTNEYRCLAKLDELGTEEEKKEKKARTPEKKEGISDDIKAVEKEYFDSFSVLYGHTPVAYDYKKNRAIIKRRLQTIPPEQICDIIQKARQDRWAVSAGFTIGVVLCETIINRYSTSGRGAGEVSEAELTGWEY